MLTKAEKESRIVEMYEQSKNYREIAHEVHMSLSDISSILKRHTGEVQFKARSEQNQQQRTIDTKAFELFEEGRTPVQVAIELDLKSEEAIRLHREWWELKGLHCLAQLHQEVGNEIFPLVTLYKHTKNAGLGPQHVINALNHLDELPLLDRRNYDLKRENTGLMDQKRDLIQYFSDLNNQIVHTKKMLDSDNIIINHNRQEIEKLYFEKQRLQTFIARLKMNSEEYEKVARIAGEKAGQILNNKQVMLYIVLASVLDALKEDPEKQLLIYDSLDRPLLGTPTIHDGIDPSVKYRKLCITKLLDLAGEVYDKLLNNCVNSSLHSAASLGLHVSGRTKSSIET